MEKRFVIPHEELKKVQNNLKDRNYTLDDITDFIDSSFRNCLYRDTSLDRKAFKHLEELYGKPISHKERLFVDGSGFHQKIEVEKNAKTAELIGLLLGDGCISRYKERRKDRTVSNYYVSISLREREDKIRKRAIDLFRHVVDEEPSLEYPKGQNIVHIKLYGKQYVEIFEEMGLKSGDKIENQISVPEWIFNRRSWMKKCLKGLVDTDGSIYRRSEDNYLVINFKNRSKSLLEGFERLCRNLDIQPSKAGKFDRQVASQEEVKKLIEKIGPIKAEEFEI